jgi:CheY-like chemotaxis protein
LAAGVAHEINNPLVYILNNVSYVLNELPTHLSELRDALKEARSGAERVRDIVKDLKTFARSDERMGPVDVRQVLESSIRVAENEIRFRAQLIRRYEDTPPVEANARLGQVFLNLLLNAAHSIREGDPLGNRIVVSTFVADGRVAISVDDTGAGIPREKLGKIFDPFFTTKPVGMGTGLGLSICRNITTALGGELQVTSEVGMGSRFTVWLPAIQQAPVQARLPSSIPPPSTVPSLRVLVVDDDAFVARAIRRLLRTNHAVTLANGGEEALALMAKHDFDVVFCDVMMPVMTGMELHQEVLRRFPPLADRFIFITGGPFTPEAKELFDQVKNPCIQKPFAPADLIQALEDASYLREQDELEDVRSYG